MAERRQYDSSFVPDYRYKRISTNGIQTSTANAETVIIPDGRTLVQYKRLTLYVESDATVIRNGDETFFIPGGSGLVLDERNTPTHSMRFTTSGIRYYGIADY